MFIMNVTSKDVSAVQGNDWERIDGRTRLIGLIATPIGHSKSPTLHNMAFRHLGLNYVYLAFDVGKAQLEDVVRGFRALNLRGFNVSMPNKTQIISYLDDLDESAKFARAVNTVVNENGKFIGYNTDGIGFLRSLYENKIDICGKKMVLLGAGGAGTAIAMQSALDGVAKLTIFNRKDEFYERALENAEIINVQMKNVQCDVSVYDVADLERLRTELKDADILVNTSGVGMHPLDDMCLIPDPSYLHPELVVADIVYSPLYTKLLKMGQLVGCKTINGLGMMLWQGAEAFKLWTGKEMPVDLIKKNLFSSELKNISN